MSKIFETVAEGEQNNPSLDNDLINNNNKRTLKSKENIFKVKCNKELKKKLKKYRLRRNYDEDPDILDVSQNLITSLKIKSPNSDTINHNIKNISETSKPKNYLLKMVRTKKLGKEPKKNLKEKESIQNESKNQMNAFKVLMDSRNKVIGSNSPGKTKTQMSLELDEITAQREIKAKRILSLEKMAEAKGSLKNREIEEYRDRFVVKKMLDRAERLKNMITSPEADKIMSTPHSKVVNNLSQNKTNEGSVIEKTKKTLQLCDLFNDATVKIEDNVHNKIADEDIEFLNKLSPSIKKKENMLSYFKKVTKESDSSLDLSDKSSPVDNKQVIKVKFTPKRKKKIKTLKSSENIPDAVNLTKDVAHTKDSNEFQEDNSERRKRKRNVNVNNAQSKKDISMSTPIKSNVIDSTESDNRPKRLIKKPIKYNDDVDLFSSDEELHIFTPKKKKNNGKLSLNRNEDKKDKNEILICDIEKKEVLTLQKEKSKLLSKHKDRSHTRLKEKKVNKRMKSTGRNSSKNFELDKKSAKLAPIFVAKSQLSPAAIEAKQKFLKSGVPEKLKKHITTQPCVFISEDFQSVVHVQQISTCTKNDDYKHDFYDMNIIEDNITVMGECLLKQFLENVPLNEVLNVKNVKHKPIQLLKILKNTFPRFPVYRTYHILKGKSKGEIKDCTYPDMDNSIEVIEGLNDTSDDNPDKLNWCEKYKPLSSKQIIGNFETIKELKRWLEMWTESLIKSKNSKNDSDSSDFYHSDTDTKDGPKNTNNLLILTGVTGSGKTSSVYAIAAELAIKVIEVNASRKRTGKIMLQDLQEATQSHKVNRGKANVENSQKSQELEVTVKKRGRPKKVMDLINTPSQSSENLTQTSQSQETAYTGMSLILIDDADIVFEQDDGFCSALSQLIQSSKRPVILVTASLSCPHLQKFLTNGKILHMSPLLPRKLGTWLDIMCLADVGFCYSGLGARVLDLNRGDIRKTINCLQFYMNSNKHTQVEEVALSQIKLNIDDETSNMSWVDSKDLEDIAVCDEYTQMYIDKQVQMLGSRETDPFNFWWSLPKYYKKISNEITTTTSECMEDISKISDAVSISDIFDRNTQTDRHNYLNKPWLCCENPSVLEIESFDDYNKSYYFSNEITQELMKISTSKAQKTLNCNIRLNISHPNMLVERQRERLVSRHKKISSFLSPSVLLDRRSIALDYWSTCRSICRLEKIKTDSTSKRNNRFFHYLKSINFLCKTELFNNLADSLS